MKFDHGNTRKVRLLHLSLAIMGAGFIYLIIVGLWVAYFLPRWINAHEEHAGKSVDRYQAMLDVVGRTATGEERYGQTSERREQLLHTRRITFMALASLLIITTLLALSGMLSPALISVPFLGIGAYVVVVRHQITTNTRKRTEDGSSVEGSNSLYRSKYAELITKVSVRQEHEEWVPLKDRISERESYQSRGITLLPRGSAAAREGWEPIAVPTPSYLSAPTAIQTRRVIDLTNPGAWSLANASRIEEEGRAALAPSPDQIFDQEVAEQVAERIERLRRAN